MTDIAPGTSPDMVVTDGLTADICAQLRDFADHHLSEESFASAIRICGVIYYLETGNFEQAAADMDLLNAVNRGVDAP